MKEYIGDGVYVTYDGYSFVLTVERIEGISTIYLEPEVFSKLIKFRDKMNDRDKPVQQIEPDIIITGPKYNRYLECRHCGKLLEESNLNRMRFVQGGGLILDSLSDTLQWVEWRKYTCHEHDPVKLKELLK